MNITRVILAGVAAAAMTAATAQAGEDAELVVEGEPLVTKLDAPEGHPLDEVLSGWRFRRAETQALQTDDFDNPGMVFVEQAAELWDLPDGEAGKACADLSLIHI